MGTETTSFSLYYFVGRKREHERVKDGVQAVLLPFSFRPLCPIRSGSLSRLRCRLGRDEPLRGEGGGHSGFVDSFLLSSFSTSFIRAERQFMRLRNDLAWLLSDRVILLAFSDEDIVCIRSWVK